MTMQAFQNGGDLVRAPVRPLTRAHGLLGLLAAVLAGLFAADCGDGGDGDVGPGSGPCETVYRGKCGASCSDVTSCSPEG